MKSTRRLIRFSFCLAALLLIVACNTEPDSSLQPLTAAQIRDMLAENTLVSAGLDEGDKGYWAVYYLTSGDERGVSGDSLDTGRWRTQEGSLCSDWNTWGTKERCFQLFRNASGQIVAFFEGKESFKALIEAGNSRAL